MKTRRAYDCAHCGELFATTTEHLVHVTLAHEPRNVSDPRPARLIRPWHCWTCRTDVPQSDETCPKCGDDRPAYRSPKP